MERREKIKVFCYGDSNTYGYDPVTGLRHPADLRWTGILQRLIGDDYLVVEQGLNGRTTVYPDPEAEWKSGIYGLKLCLSTYRPVEIMILMLGTNDLKSVFHASPEEITAGIEKLIEETQAYMTEKCGKPPVIILASPILLGDNIAEGPFGGEFDSESVRKSHRLASLYEEAAKRHGCLFMNAADHAAVSKEDAVHMMPEEHAKLAEAMAEMVGKAAEILEG